MTHNVEPLVRPKAILTTAYGHFPAPASLMAAQARFDALPWWRPIARARLRAQLRAYYRRQDELAYRAIFDGVPFTPEEFA